MTGERCSDGQPLRFYYRGGSPFPLEPGATPIPEELLRQFGVLTLGIDPTDALGRDITGYMLFTTTGPWRVTAQSARRELGEVVILVRAR